VRFIPSGALEHGVAAARLMDESETAESSCLHEEVEFLGEDSGRNRYSRCRACASILIRDNVKVWVIRPGGPLEPHG
jgi:hypothetical protein